MRFTVSLTNSCVDAGGKARRVARGMESAAPRIITRGADQGTRALVAKIIGEGSDGQRAVWRATSLEPHLLPVDPSPNPYDVSLSGPRLPAVCAPAEGPPWALTRARPTIVSLAASRLHVHVVLGSVRAHTAQGDHQPPRQCPCPGVDTHPALRSAQDQRSVSRTSRLNRTRDRRRPPGSGNCALRDSATT